MINIFPRLRGRNTYKVLLTIFFVSISFLYLYNITLPINEWVQDKQAVVAMIARNFYEGDMNIMYPELDSNGSRSNFAANEFPLHPWLMALGYKVFGVHEVFGRILSILFFIGSAFFFRMFLREYKLGTWASNFFFFFYTISFLSIGIGRSLQPESIWMFLIAGTFYFFEKFFNHNKKKYFIYFSLFCSLSIAIKPFVIFLYLFLLFRLVISKDRKKYFSYQNIFIFLVSFSIPIIWYFNVYAISETQDVLFTPESSINYILPFSYWPMFLFKIIRWYGIFLFSPFFAILLCSLGVMFFLRIKKGLIQVDKSHQHIIILFLVTAGYYLFFSNRLYGHTYYHILGMVSVLVIGALFVDYIIRTGISRKVLIAFTILIFLHGLFVFRLSMKSSLYRLKGEWTRIVPAAEVVREFTQSGDLVVASSEKTANLLYYSDRVGWFFSVNDKAIAEENAKNRDRYLTPVKPMYTNVPEKAHERLEWHIAEGAAYFVATQSLNELSLVNPEFYEYLTKKYALVTSTYQYSLFDLKD
ncbi:hypothetical protein C0581_02975 [Candidatus Parcubacteria bacterium]|nr:MAG: hypothetical protein C0581_02975 [Candidatus Parcubacteria bacterium]